MLHHQPRGGLRHPMSLGFTRMIFPPRPVVVRMGVGLASPLNTLRGDAPRAEVPARPAVPVALVTVQRRLIARACAVVGGEI